MYIQYMYVYSVLCTLYCTVITVKWKKLCKQCFLVRIWIRPDRNYFAGYGSDNWCEQDDVLFVKKSKHLVTC